MNIETQNTKNLPDIYYKISNMAALYLKMRAPASERPEALEFYVSSLKLLTQIRISGESRNLFTDDESKAIKNLEAALERIVSAFSAGKKRREAYNQTPTNIHRYILLLARYFVKEVSRERISY